MAKRVEQLEEPALPAGHS